MFVYFLENPFHFSIIMRWFLMLFQFTCHANICKQCCGNWIRAKISEENVIPFVRCPAEDCDCPIPAFVYMDEGLKLKTSDLYKMVSVYCEKQLARNSNWVSCCNTKSCKYGVLLKLNENEKEIECMFYESHESAEYYFFSMDSGDNCGTKQTVKKKVCVRFQCLNNFRTINFSK